LDLERNGHIMRKLTKEDIHIQLSTQKDIPVLHAMYNRAKMVLEDQDLFQWDDVYPNRAFFEHACMQEHLYIVSKGKRIIGGLVLNEEQEDEWNDVDWVEGEPALVVHALCVDPLDQQKGIGSIIIDFCEERAIEGGYTSIRLDMYSKNVKAMRLYEKKGFVYRGEIYFSSKKEGNQKYLCYEKKIPLSEKDAG
jgi:ribosomal protein S18 acetylase RimI-like enzyme